MFTVKDFQYVKKDDIYICPAGENLHYKSTVTKGGLEQRIYKTKSCMGCKIRARCTTAKWGRRIYRWEHEEIIEEMNEKLKSNPEIMEKRKTLVEHPFGTLKRTMNHGYFLTKGLDNVRTEFSLSVLTYNIKRVLNIVDFKLLMAAVAQKRVFFIDISFLKVNIKRKLLALGSFLSLYKHRINYFGLLLYRV